MNNYDVIIIERDREVSSEHMSLSRRIDCKIAVLRQDMSLLRENVLSTERK